MGTYDLSIQAAANSGAVIPAGTGSAVGGAAYGLGSVTVESVAGARVLVLESSVRTDRGESPGFLFVDEHYRQATPFTAKLVGAAFVPLKFAVKPNPL